VKSAESHTDESRDERGTRPAVSSVANPTRVRWATRLKG
jgi:hypothetical protein